MTEPPVFHMHVRVVAARRDSASGATHKHVEEWLHSVALVHGALCEATWDEVRAQRRGH